MITCPSPIVLFNQLDLLIKRLIVDQIELIDRQAIDQPQIEGWRRSWGRSPVPRVLRLAVGRRWSHGQMGACQRPFNSWSKCWTSRRTSHRVADVHLLLLSHRNPQEYTKHPNFNSSKSIADEYQSGHDQSTGNATAFRRLSLPR